MSKRLSHIDALEAIAILLVVFYHSTLYPYDFITGDTSFSVYYIRYLIRTIVSTCVPLFFFVNGYLLFPREYSLKKHLIRTFRLAILPLIGLFMCPIYMLISGTQIDVKRVILYWLNMDKEWSVNRYWFIGALVCIYIFFPAIKMLYEYDIKSFYIFTVALFFTTFGIRFLNIVLTLANQCVSALPDKINYPIFDMYVPIRKYGYSFVYFCLGGIIHKHENTLLAMKNSIRNRIGIVMMILSCISLFAVGVIFSCSTGVGLWDVVWEGYDTIPTLVNTITLYMFSLNIVKRNRMIERISQDTLWVYVLHGLIVRITKPHLLYISACRTIVFNIFYAVFIVIVCTALTEIIKKIHSMIAKIMVN